MAEPTAEESAAAEAKAKADAEAQAKADAEAKAKAAELKFSQADVDKYAGTARSEGRAAAEKELLEKLGITDLATAEAVLKAARDAEEAQKSELQRLTEERDRANTQAEQAKAEAQQAVAVTRLEGALRDAGMKPERIAAALKLADLSTLKVDGTEVTGVAEAVEAVKATSPEWFGASTGAPDANATSGEPVDFRTDKAARATELAKYGIR